MRYQHLPKAKRRAATAVECSLVIGATLFLLLAIFEYGLFIMVRNVVDAGAREGARLAVSGTNTLTTTDIQNRVRAVLAGQRLGTLTIQVYWADALGNNYGLWNDAPFGARIAVDVTCNYTPVLPALGFLANPVSLRGKAIMRSEAN